MWPSPASCGIHHRAMGFARSGCTCVGQLARQFWNEKRCSRFNGELGHWNVSKTDWSCHRCRSLKPLGGSTLYLWRHVDLWFPRFRWNVCSIWLVFSMGMDVSPTRLRGGDPTYQLDSQAVVRRLCCSSEMHLEAGLPKFFLEEVCGSQRYNGRSVLKNLL